MKKELICALLAVGCLSANAATLVEWNTAGNAGTETSEPSVFNIVGLQSSTLTLGPGVTAASNGNRFGGSGWFDAGNTNPSTLAEAISGNSYIEFTITPTNGYSFSVTSFSFIWDFSSTGPKSVALFSSIDSYSTSLGSVVDMTTSTSTVRAISISGITNQVTAVTFRLYGYSATAAAGTGGFDTTSANTTPNVSLSGSVALVPEPSSLALLGIGGAFVLYRKRRRMHP